MIYFIVKVALFMNSNQDTNNSSYSNNVESLQFQQNFSDNINSKNSENGGINSNINSSEEDNYKSFSKKCKILMVLTLVGALIIFLDNFITSTDWYWNLIVSTIFTHNDQLKQVLESFKNLIEVFNWIIVLIITIVSVIFLFMDKKQKKNVSIYEWYIFAGLLHIFLGTIGITSILYSVSTLIISIKNKNAFIKEGSKKVSKFYIIFSLIITSIILIVFLGVTTGLFDKIENKMDEIKENIENKDKIIEDNDISHIVTTFDNFITDWGNDITKNKFYKIKNVKLNNVTASLYIDYTYELNGTMPVSTITIKHGDDEIYKYSSKVDAFNVSYLSIYDNFIIYGASNCDSVNNGICEKHLTYSQVVAFNKDVTETFYDKHAIERNNETIISYFETSRFLEDENVYAAPYNDFRVYAIKIKDNYLYFDTIVENYDEVFISNGITYDYNCKSPFWYTLSFDMQRSFRTEPYYLEEYNYYVLDDIQKVSSIKYEDYCNNKNIIIFN